MKNTKNIKIIVSLLAFGILYILIIFVLRGSENLDSGYIIISDISGFFCENTKCERADVIKYQGENFKVYQNSNYLGEYQLKNYENVWNFYQEDKWQSVRGKFIAVQNELEHEVMKYEIRTMSKEEKNQVKTLLKTNNIFSETGEFDNFYVYNVDLDQNGEIDKIISVSNQAEGVTTKTYFSGVFVNLNGEWSIPILEKESNVEKYRIPFFDIVEFIKINKETKIILNRNYYDSIDESISIMLRVNKNKIDIEIAK